MASLLTKLNSCPPFLCRILARKNRGRAGLSHDELAERSGLARSTIAALSFKTSWEGIPVDTADRFAQACGVNHLSAKRQVYFMVHRQLGTFMLRATNSQKLMYRKLFGLLDKWATPKSTEPSTH